MEYRTASIHAIHRDWDAFAAPIPQVPGLRSRNSSRTKLRSLTVASNRSVNAIKILLPQLIKERQSIRTSEYIYVYYIYTRCILKEKKHKLGDLCEIMTRER